MSGSPLLDDWSNILLLELKQETCMLMGDAFGVLIQLTLGVLAFGCLLYKRFREKPRREWDVWLADTSKQAIGSLIAHGFNMLFSDILTNQIEDNPCLYYFVNFLIDSLLGMLLCFGMLKVLQRMRFWERCGCCLWNADSGFYGDPPQGRIWLGQLGVWLAIVTVVKFVLLGMIVAVKHPLYRFGAWVMSPINNYPRVELVVVMVVVPFLVNVVVFWISDNFLMHTKAKGHTHVASSSSSQQRRATDAHDNSAMNGASAATASTNATDNESGVDRRTDDEDDDETEYESGQEVDGRGGDGSTEGGIGEDDETLTDSHLATSSLSSYQQKQNDQSHDPHASSTSVSDSGGNGEGKRYSKTRIMFRQSTAARKANSAATATDQQPLLTRHDNDINSNNTEDSHQVRSDQTLTDSSMLSSSMSSSAMMKGGDDDYPPPDDPRHLQNSL